jgi:3-methyladenine DNA glycosylase/8-oxoguanine DNA glycosylase
VADDFVAKLVAVTDVDEVTAQTMALRALADPDVLPLDTSVCDRAKLKSLVARADRWRPFRAYAYTYLTAPSTITA